MCRWYRIDFRRWPKLSWIRLYYIRLLLSLCLTAINLDESEVIWDCSRLVSDTKMLPEIKHLAWNTSEKFNVLGIHLNFYIKDNMFENEKKKWKIGKEHFTFMGSQGLNLYCANNRYEKMHWHSRFGALSHSTVKPFCSRYERNIR